MRTTEMIYKEVGWNDMNWIHLPYDRNQFRTILNTVKNLHVTQEAWNSELTEQLLASREPLCSMELASP
jgi:hypothetical protein